MDSGSVVDSDLGAPPESWEVADLDASVRNLMLSSSSKKAGSTNSLTSSSSANDVVPDFGDDSGPEDLVNSVDQFLREALQNPRERLSVLRMEQDIEKFIRDPNRQQIEFQQLPTSYLRLAAHRVAQHYSLQSMVLMENNLPDGSGSRIIVRKTAECRLPSIRLADIPLTLPSEDNGAIKVAIKQRPQKGSLGSNGLNSHLSKSNSLKSVEERKEEYNKARARIFNSNSFSGIGSASASSGRGDIEPRKQEITHHVSRGVTKTDEKSVPVAQLDQNVSRAVIDSAPGSSKSARANIEKEPVNRSKGGANRVAIFRDREVDRKDPDYDRNYDRYMQRFDPGFGFNGVGYTIQPMYAPAINYNTEFPQLGTARRPPMSTEHQQQPPPHQHLPPWTSPSAHAGIGYGIPEAMMTPFSPNHVGVRSNNGLYLHSAQYPFQHPGMPFIHPHEQAHQSFVQSHQPQPDATYGLARPR